MNQQLSWRTIVGYSLGDVANNFAFAMGALFLLSYYTDVAGVGAAAAGTMLLLVRVFDAFADVFAGRVVDSVNTRWGKFRPFLLFGTAPLMIFSVLFFWVSVWSLPVALVALAIASIGQGVTMTVMWALEADTVEYGEYLTGVRIEGLTYSLFSFTRKCGQAIGGSIPAFILGLSGYIANQVQTPEVIMGIRTSIALVPCGFMLLAFVIIWFYPLTDKKFKEIVVEIDNRKKVQQQLISDITN